MKKLLLTFFALITWAAAYSQLTNIWCENFDGTVSTTSTGNPGFSVDANYWVSPANCIKGETVDTFGICTLTSPVFSTVGQNYVMLNFDQICKIDFSDLALIQFSLDGVTWTSLDANPLKINQGGTGNCYYYGTGNFLNNGNSFSEGSYPAQWEANFQTAPLNTWWQHETFDISLAVANQPTVQIRFYFEDQFDAMNGRYGWLMDNICVGGAPCEVFPPVVTLPYPTYIYYTGTVFNLPPYDIFASIADPSGISAAELYYTVNNGPVQSFGGMVNLTDTLWAGSIFSGGIGDTICYWIEATDNSGCNNTIVFPPNGGCIPIIPIDSLRPPFCDNFDIPNQNFANDPLSTGTLWTNGYPSGTVLATPHSGTNVWGIGNVSGAGDYANSTSAYLVSAPVNFSNATVVNFEMYINSVTETDNDGVTVFYSLNNGTSWNVLGTANDPNGVNWYNSTNVGGSGVPGWTGLTNGWKKVSYKLVNVPGIMGNPAVLFRFKFFSNSFTTDDGFHIDDVCLNIPCLNDLSVASIDQPLNGSGTPAGSSNPLSITVANNGVNPQTGFTINYTVGGVPQTPITYNGTLGGGLTTQITMPNYTVPNNGYDVCVWTSLPGDCIPANDTVCGTYVGIPTYTPTPSYCDDFDAGNTGWSTVNDPTNAAGNDWQLGTPTFGATSSTHSGANCWDINLNSGYTDEALCFLYSPYFDFSGISAGNMEFWINIDAENGYDGLRLEYTLDNGVSWQVLGTGPNDACGGNWYNDNQVSNDYFNNTPAWTGSTGGWVKATYKFCCAPGIFNNPLPIQFRFAFASDFIITLDGVSVDDFCIFSSVGDDVGITSIQSPSGGFPVGQSVPVVVVMENFGSTTVTSVPINYTANGNLQTIIWSGNLPPCGTVTVPLPNFNVVQGVNPIVAFTSLSGDLNNSNDSSSTFVVGQPLIAPTYQNWYSDNFDAGNIGWAPFILPGGDPGSQWELGTPNFGQTSGAYSAPNCWDVNLTSAATGGANCVLTTPYFDLTNAAGAILRFWQNRNIYEFGDEFRIEYSLDNTNWFLLQPSQPNFATNWYNNNPPDYWDDASAGWEQSILRELPSVFGTPAPAQVQFRFVLQTVTFTNADGVSIDNFEIFVPIPLSVTPVEVTTSVPCQFIYPGQPITFASPIKNNGYNPVYVHNATLTIDGSIVSVDQVAYTPNPGSLVTDSAIVHNFNNTWIAVPGFHQVCVYTDSPNGTADLSTSDDTTCVSVLVFDSIASSQLPYCTSFESGNQWVTANSLTYCIQNDWQLGTPAKPNLNGAHTGNNAWSTNLTGTYANKDSSGLFSALIRVQTNHCYKMSFYQQYRTEYGTDGGALHYSDDYGVSWNRLNLTGTPNMQLYGPSPNYTYVSELDPTEPASKGFTGTRNDWFYTEKVFRPDVNSQIIMRWRFASDWSIVEEGWDIDDFCFEDLGTCAPIGIEEYAINNFGMSQNYPNPAEDNTTFDIAIPASGQVRILITDIVGQVVNVVADQYMDAGVHTFNVNTSGIAAGLYTYTMIYEGEQVSKRMVITH